MPHTKELRLSRKVLRIGVILTLYFFALESGEDAALQMGQQPVAIEDESIGALIEADADPKIEVEALLRSVLHTSDLRDKTIFLTFMLPREHSVEYIYSSKQHSVTLAEHIGPEEFPLAQAHQIVTGFSAEAVGNPDYSYTVRFVVSSTDKSPITLQDMETPNMYEVYISHSMSGAVNHSYTFRWNPLENTNTISIADEVFPGTTVLTGRSVTYSSSLEEHRTPADFHITDSRGNVSNLNRAVADVWVQALYEYQTTRSLATIENFVKRVLVLIDYA